MLFGRRLLDGVLFALRWLILGFVAQLALARVYPLAVFKILVPALLVLVVIRSLAGREAIVPSWRWITGRVENLSLADSHVWRSGKVQVGYGSDLDLVVRLLQQAALAPSQVLRDPGPGINWSSFAADGLGFTVGFRIADPENGTGNVTSWVNWEILRWLPAHDIEIAFSQRVIHVDAGSRAGLGSGA